MGSPRGSYKVVASSDNVSDEFVTEVRKIFQGCRPKSVDVNDFSTTLIATPFLKQSFIMLRMELFHDHDLGHFIQEHYVVVEKDNLSQQTTDHFEIKPWFWLLNIPDIQLYSSIEKLSNTVSLNLNAGFLTQIGKATSLLSAGDSEFEEVLKNTISILLSGPPAVVQVKEGDILDKRFWCIALSLLLPAKETSSLRVFIGRNPPDNWNFELGIVTKNSSQQKEKFIKQTSTLPINQDNQFLKFSFQVQRWLEISRSEKFIADLINMIDNVNVDWQSPIIQKHQTNLDVAFGISAMSTIGLILARKETQKGIINPTELQWIWRNMSYRNGGANNLLSIGDLLNFLPILIKENLDNWNRDDFSAFSDIVSIHLTEPERLFNSFEGDDETLANFLKKWIGTNDFSSKEEKLFFSIMKKIASKNFSSAIVLMTQWIEHHKNGDINLFFFLSELVTVQHEPISLVDFTRFFFIFCYQLRDNNDLNLFGNAIWKLSIEKDAKEYRNRILEFLAFTKGKSFSKREKLNIFHYLIETGRYIEFAISDIIFAFFHIIIVVQNADTFESLTAVVHSEYHQGLHVSTRKGLESDWYVTAQTWVLNANNASLFAAYTYILMQFSDVRIIQEFLTKLLIKTPNLFLTVTQKLSDLYSVERGTLAINLSAMQKIEKRKRLHLLSEFLLSTRSQILHPTVEEADIFYQTLLAVDNIKTIETKKQLHLISLFQFSEDNYICQRIVEHQIRDALNQKPPNFEKAKKGLHNFKIILRQTKTKWVIKSRLQPDINIALSYLRGLNEKELRNFLQWFLKSSFDSLPRIDTQHYPATAKIVELNAHWLTSNPFVRLRLFEETINILQKSPTYESR